MHYHVEIKGDVVGPSFGGGIVEGVEPADERPRVVAADLSRRVTMRSRREYYSCILMVSIYGPCWPFHLVIGRMGRLLNTIGSSVEYKRM
jgi:hypothetical protein